MRGIEAGTDAGRRGAAQKPTGKLKLRVEVPFAGAVTQHFDAVVVGSGPAGQKAAITCAKYGQRVLLVDRDKGIGA